MKSIKQINARKTLKLTESVKQFFPKVSRMTHTPSIPWESGDGPILIRRPCKGKEPAHNTEQL